MKNKGLTLKSCDGRESIDASFDDKRLLFLVSSPNGLCLVNEIANGEIVYVIFSLNNDKVFAAPINQAAAIDDRARFGVILRGMSISIGLRKFTIQKLPSARSGWTWFATPLAVLVAVFSFAMASINKTKNVKVESTPAAISETPVNDNSVVENLLAEAREFLRSGDISQARLTLIAAGERGLDDPRIERLLLEIGKMRVPEELETDAKEDGSGALFKEGLKSIDNGDRLSAKKSFDRARNILKNKSTALPFVSALEDARKQNEEILAIELKPKYRQIGEVINEALGMTPKAAMMRLKAVSDELSKITDAMAGDNDAAALKENYDKTVKMIALKWIASAKTAERLSGCARALSMYEAISSDIGAMEPSVSQDAAECASACRRPPK